MNFSVLSRILTSTLNIAFPISIKALDCLISMVSMANKEKVPPVTKGADLRFPISLSNEKLEVLETVKSQK